MLFSALLFVFAACSKDAEDKLEGKWQLREVSVNGQTEKIDTVFYNFQTSLFMYQLYDKATNSYSHIYGFKTLEEPGRLLLEMNSPAESIPAFLLKTDWESKAKDFRIEKVSGSRLVLSSEDKHYIFRRF
jgi:hypothetical protein